jgi:carbon monoxide dehydrogenase subunit G
MKIEETFVLQAPSDEVFAFLSDVEQVASCVPGVEGLRQTDDGGWEAGLKAQLGPITAAFRGQVQLTTTPPGRLEAAGKGQDRASGSRVEVGFTADVTSLDGHRSQVDAVADVTIRGRLGQFGTGVIRATATELIREFVTCADARLQVSATDPLATAARTAPPSTTTSQTPPWKLALRIIARTIRDSIRSLVERVRTARKG